MLIFNELIDFSNYEVWRGGFFFSPPIGHKETTLDSLPVYGLAYRLAIEATETATPLERNYRYSLGEDIRLGVKKTVLSITLAGKGEELEANVHIARISVMDVQLSLRLLNDLNILPNKRYVYFLEITEEIVKQLSNWERSLSKQRGAAGVPSPP